MKAKYRKFVIGRHKYCFWLRFYQTLFNGVKESSKAETDWKKQARKEINYEHNKRRKSKRLKVVILGLSRAIKNENNNPTD